MNIFVLIQKTGSH